jgi:hypothetical protein
MAFSCVSGKVIAMQMPTLIRKYYWWLPCCIYSNDVYAWGLVTHLYFAQSLVWAMPLLDPRLQNAIKRFPELVMAGACLPDLALISYQFRHTHLWENAHHLLQRAQTDEETAIAVGYASHLYIDVIAHHHFVPAHEAMWLKNTIATHIASEWAMDAYLAPLMNTSPRQLLNKHQATISTFISPHFRCHEHVTNIALRRLALGDGFLRLIKLPHIIYQVVRFVDKRINSNFIYYVAKTQIAIADIAEVLNGNKPLYEPEQKNISVEQLDQWRDECLDHLKIMHPRPIQYFAE